jgi:hypothetical protein
MIGELAIISMVFFTFSQGFWSIVQSITQKYEKLVDLSFHHE